MLFLPIWLGGRAIGGWKKLPSCTVYLYFDAFPNGVCKVNKGSNFKTDVKKRFEWLW